MAGHHVVGYDGPQVDGYFHSGRRVDLANHTNQYLGRINLIINLLLTLFFSHKHVRVVERSAIDVQQHQSATQRTSQCIGIVQSLLRSRVKAG